MKIRPCSCFAALLLFLAAKMFAQNAPETKERIFEDAIRIQHQYWENRTQSPGNGYKTVRRWEHYWENRLLPDGTFPPADINQRAWANFEAQQKKTKANEPAENQAIASWISLGPASNASGLGRVNCVAVAPSNPNLMYAGAAGGGLWRSSNGGLHWVPMTDQKIPNLGITAIALPPNAPGRMYIATGDGFGRYIPSIGVWRSDDSGQNWVPTGLVFKEPNQVYIRQLLIRPDMPQILLAATSQGIYQTQDGGNTWARTAIGNFWDLRFRPGAANIVYAAEEGGLRRSTDGGLTWASIPLPVGVAPRRIALAVTPANANLVMALCSDVNGNFGGLLASTDAGASFSVRFGAAGNPNLLNRDVAGGAGIQGQGNYDLALAISPTNANQVWVGGVNLWRSNNGGTAWSLATFWSTGTALPIVHADIHNFTWEPNGNLLECTDGGLYRATNAVSTWGFISNGMAIGQHYRIGTLPTGNKTMFGAQDNGTALLENGTWRDLLGGDGGECAQDPTRPNTLYAETQQGALRRSLNNGTNWTLVRPPNAPNGAWVTPYQLDPTNPNTLYAGYDAVYRSNDQGATWATISPAWGAVGNELRCLVVAPSNPNALYASNRTGIWRSTNAGASWGSISSGLPINGNIAITSIAVDPANADRIFVTIGGYSQGNKVFRSNDGGATWINWSANLPDLPAFTVAFEPGSFDALYVGMDIGVFYRNGAMSSWALFNVGLPHAPVYELEIQAAAGTIRAATFGRGVWQSSLQPQGVFSVTPAQVNLPASASIVQRLSVTAYAGWTVTSDQTWVSVGSMQVGTTTVGGNPYRTFDGWVDVSVVPNTGNAPRTATLTFVSGGLTKTVAVAQAGVGSPTCSDDGEFGTNDYLAFAPPIALGKPKESIISRANDKDHWRISLPVQADLNVSLYNLPADYTLMVYDGSGRLIGQGTQPGTTAENVMVANQQPGTYYLGVISTAGAFSATQCYTLLATAVPRGNCAADNEPGNNTAAGAMVLPIGIGHSSLLQASGDMDFYRINLTQTTDLSVQLFNLPADYELELTDQSGNRYGSYAAGTTPELIRRTLSAGTYYARVFAQPGLFSATNCYSIIAAPSIQTEVCQNALEPQNNQPSTLAVVPVGVPFQSQLAGHSGNDPQDFWKFSIAATAHVTVSLQRFNADMELRVLDAQLRPLGASSNLGNLAEHVYLANLPPGDYYAVVYSAAAFSIPQCYNLNIQTAPLTCSNDLEPLTNSLSEAPFIPTGSTKSSVMGTGDPFDVWTFTVPVSTAYVTASVSSPTTSGFWLEIRDLQGSQKGYGTQLYLNLLAGQYWAIVRGPATGACYDLSVRVAQPSFCENDGELSNNSANTYTPEISLGTVKRSIVGNNSDRDWWKFVLTTTATVTATLSDLPANYDLQIRFGNGATLGSSSNTGTHNETVVLTLTPGTYFAFVQGVNGSYHSSACYSLKVAAALPGGCANQHEPANNATSTAPSIGLNTEISSQIGTFGDQDYWKFSVAANSAVQIQLTPPLIPSVPCSFELTGSGIPASVISNHSRSYWEGVLPVGTYTIRIHSPAGMFTTQDCYRLKVTGSVLPACANGNEPANNATATAPSIPMNTYLYSRLGTAGDIDIWKFTVYSHSEVQLDLFNLPADFDLHLLDHFGNGVAESFLSGIVSERIRLALTPGVYYALVGGKNNTFHASACYALKISDGRWGQRTQERLAITTEETEPKPEALGTLRVYPNPSEGLFHIDLPIEGACQLVLFDPLGRVMNHWEAQGAITVDVSEHKPGIYRLLARQAGQYLGILSLVKH